jgi:hypothetical protein
MLKPHEHRSDREQDKVLEDSFPASDPPANAGVTGADAPGVASSERLIEERPTGLPTPDRHCAETAHHWEHEETGSAERKP